MKMAAPLQQQATRQIRFRFFFDSKLVFEKQTFKGSSLGRSYPAYICATLGISLKKQLAKY